MKKKKSPTRTLQLIKNPGLEHTFVKIPRQELVNMDKRSTIFGVDPDIYKLNQWIQENRKDKKFISGHTHSKYDLSISTYDATPSPADLLNILTERDKINTEYIAQQNEKNGKIQGWTALHNQAKEKINSKEFTEKEELIKEYEQRWFKKAEEGEELDIEEIENLAKKVGIKIKYHPAKGYYLNRQTGTYEKKSINIEKIVSSVLLGFAFIFFLTNTKFTGAAISNFIPSNYQNEFFILIGFILTAIFYLICWKK